MELGDLSATGSAEGSGVMVAKVNSGSEAAGYGLKALDVIRAVNGKAVHLVKELTALRGRPEVLSVWRNQRLIELRRP